MIGSIDGDCVQVVYPRHQGWYETRVGLRIPSRGYYNVLILYARLIDFIVRVLIYIQMFHVFQT